MNIEEENKWQEDMTTPTSKVNLVVELNSNVMRNLHSIQDELKSIREYSLNERKEGSPEATKGYHHSPTSDDSLSPWRKRQRNDDSLQGYFEK